MSLLAYNLTTAPLALAAGNPVVTLPASTSAGARGPAINVTAELQGLPALGGYDLLQAQVTAGQVQYEWTGFPEFNTFSLVVGSAQTDIAEGDVDIYLNGVTGNDANPGTASAPVATWTRVLQLIPGYWKKRCRVYAAAGTYQFLPGLNAIGQPLGPDATPLIIIGEKTVLQTVTSTLAGGTNLITDAGAGMTVDAYIGAAITCVTGANAGQRVMCARNTATTLQCNANFSSPIGIGDTFAIERPTSIFNYTASGGIDAIFARATLAFKDVQMTLGASSRLLFSQCIIAGTENVQFGPIGASLWFNFLSSVCIFASFNNFFAREGVNNPFSNLRFSCGAYFSSGTVQFNGSLFPANRFVTQNANISVIATQAPGSITAWSKGGSWNTTTNAYMAFSPNGTLASTFDTCPMTVDASTLVLSTCVLNNAPAAAIAAANRSFLRTSSVSGLNGTYGITLATMSLLNRSGTTTVSGATSDVRVGAVDKLYAALPYAEATVPADATTLTGNRAQ